MSRRDGAIVAWHEVPRTAPPQKSRPVGYGVIRAGVRTDSMLGVTKFRIRKLKNFMLKLKELGGTQESGVTGVAGVLGVSLGGLDWAG